MDIRRERGGTGTSEDQLTYSASVSGISTLFWFSSYWPVLGALGGLVEELDLGILDGLQE